MEIVEELKDNKVVLVLVSSVGYNDIMLRTVSKLAKESVCYVTLNKTYESLKESFKKSGINTDNIVFIDAVSSMIKSSPKQTEGCYFIQSPDSLTEMSLTITRMLNHKFKYLIFDSITNMLIYQKKAPVSRFLSTIINKIRESETKAVFFALSIREQEELIQESEMFVDKVIDLGK